VTKCSNCGSTEVKKSEVMRKNASGIPAYFLINTGNELPHRCLGGKKPKIVGSKQKGFQCKRCGTYIEFYEKYFKYPKLQEVDTYRQHTYQRCDNIILEKGIEDDYNHLFQREIFDFDIDTQMNIIHAMPADSKIWDFFRPRLSPEEYKLTWLLGIDPPSQIAIRKMNINEWRDFLIKLGHLKPLVDAPVYYDY